MAMTLQELQAYIASGGRGAANSYGDMSYGDWTLGAPMLQRPGDVLSESESGPQLATGYSLNDRQGLFGGMQPQIDQRTGQVTIGGQTMSADEFQKRYLTATNIKGEGFGPTDGTMGAFDTQTGQMVGQDQWHTAGMSALDKLLAAGIPAAVLAGGAMGLGGLFGGGAGAGAAAGEGAAALGNGAFLGEGVASGVGAWDAALANAVAGGGTAAMGLDQVGALNGGDAGQVIKTMGQGAPTVDVGAISAGSPLQAGLGSQLPGSVELLGQFGAGLSGATNPALIESAAGTPGYGASSAGLGGGAAAAAGGLGGLLNGAGSILDSVGGLKNVLPIVGGLIGAGEAGNPTTSTRESKTDPRLDQYLYGSGYGDQNSLLGASQALWQQNKSGMNPTMQAGLDMQKSALMDPAYAQSYQNMRSVGNGLLNTPAAGNPFTNGQQGKPTMQAGGPGGLLGGMDIQSLIRQGRGLIG